MMIKIQAAARLKASDDNGDRERLEQLKTQIQQVEEDVREIEEDGDDAEFERKHLEKLRDEQRKLKDKMGIGASARLKRLEARRTGVEASAEQDRIVVDLKKVGFKNIFKSEGSYTMAPMKPDQVEKLCDKLLKQGYDVQADNLYPSDDDGMFYIFKGDMDVAIDPEGYIYIELN